MLYGPDERKLAGLEGEFDSAWKGGVSTGAQIKQDLLNFVIVGAFFFLSWFFLFAIFLIPSAIGASLLNIKFLVRAIRQGFIPLVLLRVIISVVVLPIYFWMVYATISSYFGKGDVQ